MTNPLSRRVRTTLFYALRAAFRLTPMPQATRDRLRQRFLDTRGDWVPEGPTGKAPEGVLPRRPYVRSDERAIGYVPYEKGELPDPLPATLVAFYLPQFHTIPENDAWWGKGFTEWRNVTRALPQFEGHYQPKLPGDLGFYDLRNVEVMHEQARLAREYGISAFCFYFYWFGGKTLLETPLRNWLNDKTIDLKFCLCWANEKWTRTWDGRGNEILIDQQHSPEDDLAFIEHVAEYMRDPRYLRVDGKPMLVVYRPEVFDNLASSTQRWRDYCVRSGIGEIHLAYVQSFAAPAPESIGFDAAIEFPPNLTTARPVAPPQLLNPDYAGQVIDWRQMAAEFLHKEPVSDLPLYRGVTPSWDNEARRTGRGRTFAYSSARAFRNWLAACIPKPGTPAGNTPLVFINAWNEWAEGAALEPDMAFGHASLKAVRDSLHFVSATRSKRETSKPVPAIIHAWYVEELAEILATLKQCPVDWRFIITTSAEREADIRRVVSAAQIATDIRIFENRGRDILPFLQVAESLVDSEDFVLKLHTKRSPHRTDGARLRADMLASLCSPATAPAILETMKTDADVGLVACAQHFHPLQKLLGANGAGLEYLTSRIGIPYPRAFPAGSMYWVRLDALSPLLDAGLRRSEFESEGSQIDGTLAHAVERAISQVVESSGYTIRQV
ncbi:Lipopolysaccharide biosynthesis protein [Pseudoxanthomonas sp. CF385]|uniref:glycoside hydrolase family 99-like domain-containing protein n=1 Tax=Pseudoxanthomonas sp. CF385 TaxID=1881042 RepID=UPI0008825120|nr:glycoside hydrolase family 99-like domain-containing protein [Pseudoxanthomonas sp. CF385]SDQ37666.1 Lipopolysaccharide biosynthesis protein [Pseudoxanthomonas sp. CF385]